MKNKQITVENTNKRLRNMYSNDVKILCHPEFNSGSINVDIATLSSLTDTLSPSGVGKKKNLLAASILSRLAAFTLAEVFITLGIIGVVAAMTMPALIANHRKTVLKTQFKKAYSELQQVNQNFIKDYDMNICEYNWQMWDETKSGYASSKATSDAFIEYYTGDGTSKSQILGSNQIKNLTGTKTVPQTLFDDGGAVDIQKRTFYFEFGVSNTKCPIISVDVNGYYKRPNQLGVDIFSFRPTKDGKIIPIGNPQTINDQINGSAVLGNNHSCTCTKKETDSITNGVCCAYWASIDINPDDNSKAYWKSFIQ
jgi:hypothetical protein